MKLEIWYVSLHTYLVSENIPFSTKAILVLLMAASFFSKNQHFLAFVPLLKAMVWELCNRFFSSVFSFCKIKGYC